MNKKGTPNNLEPAHPGNVNAVRHGAYSDRALEPRREEVVEELMKAPHVIPLDRFVVEEIARLWTLIEAMDADLAERGLRKRDSGTRSMIELRLRASGRLERWLREAHLTPATRSKAPGEDVTIVNVNPMAGTKDGSSPQTSKPPR
jgi:hypothetical protein